MKTIIEATKMKENGVPIAVIERLKFDFPSLKSIRGHNTKTTAGILVVNLPGVYSHEDNRRVMYKLIIDATTFPHNKPQAFIFSPTDKEIMHVNIFNEGPYSIWPNRLLCPLCDGVDAKRWQSQKGDLFTRFSWWINQVHGVLKNPNPDDHARVNPR
jgi:hypothetical protein